MGEHYTPIQVARVLAKHAPQRIKRILDPSVGEGILLQPFIKRLQGPSAKVICVDRKSEVLEHVKGKFRKVLGNSLKLINADFLQWASRSSGKNFGKLDCIVMNPPYAAKKSDLVELDFSKEGIGSGRCYVPLEAAFVLKALKMLRPGGRLLAIIPSSIVSSLTTKWIREYMLNEGSIPYVHELPKFTFKGVEGRVYLLVFVARSRQGNIKLSNHDLLKPHHISLSRGELIANLRYDYRYHDARNWYKSANNSSPDLDWVELGTVAKIFRGKLESPAGILKGIHTCDYNRGFWDPKNRKIQPTKKGLKESVDCYDILVKRVGRGCALSFGRLSSQKRFQCSDCLLIIRPKDRNLVTELLLSARIIFSFPRGMPLLEQGTGASYITERSLAMAMIPIGLSKRYSQSVRRYKRAIASRQFEVMSKIEDEIRCSL